MLIRILGIENIKQKYTILSFWVYKMFKFLSGVTTGWIAARSLPPRNPDAPLFALPTVTEITLLAEQLKKAAANLQVLFLKEPPNKES
jgi:hypothetical protein